MAPGETGCRSACAGLFTRRERWGLSARGVVAFALLLAGLATGAFFGAYPFFALTARVDTPLLAMEGWIDTYAVRATIEEFNRGPYTRVFTTGGPIHGMGGYTNDYNTTASVGASRLKALGLRPDQVQMVASRVEARDRTYESAVALKNWFRENQVPFTAINVVTVDVHARRTRLLFEKAFGPGVKVGIISVPNPDYPAERWYRYSQGVRAVVGEVVGYLYATVFFHP